MAHINFEIPVVVSELLQDNSEHYYVKEAINAKRLPGKLKEAKQLYKEDGIEYIFDYFDTYISVVLNITQLSRDVQVTAFEDLHRATKDLDKSVSYLLSDKDVLTDELRLKYVNLVKMLIYAYVNVTIAVNNKDPSNTVYKKGRSNLADERSINKNDVLLQINSILHQEINLFWDPPVVEEALINQIAEVCYNFIEQSLTIKSDKELCTNMFHIFGTLLTKYRYGSRFVYRIAEVVKSYEHAVPIISEGIKLLVENYNTKSLIREFVKRITEWQTDVMYQNAQATRNCAHVLSEMAKIMPEFMLEEVMYLTEYLNNEVCGFILPDTIAHQNEGEFLLKLIHNFYLDIASQLLSLADTDREDVKNLNKQQELVDYYEDVVKFLKVLETSIQPMRDLLESVNISEMHEAIDFFIATYKFDIDDSLQGILEMLHIMQRPEQDRKVAITNALKAIFLETDATSMPEHRKIIVDRLINLMETITFDKIDSFKLVIHNWVSEGKLDNNVIECVFQYFIKKHDIPDKISLKALQLLSLIAPAKKSIVTKNLRMISELVFENRGIDNMILFSETCHLITTGTREQQLVTDKSPPFKLKPADPMWTHIVDILSEVAVCQLSFLDETVYKEIKRRLYVATEKANTKNKRNVKDYSTASSSRRNATTSASIITDDGEESVLEGAQADDAEADFILNVLENKIVTLPTSLGAFAPLIVTICENPDKYDDECLQCVAVLAMLRLNDADLKVQKITFYTLANLLLRDMLRVKSHIAFMAIFISEDENNELSSMSKNFFNTLSVKDNHLYNVLPDIFSHLVGTKDVDEDQFRFIMKYLINLITSTKHTENLVDRFCIKFMGTEDVYVCRNIAYCLSLLQYNEKAAIVTELEDKINSVFQITEDDKNEDKSQPKPVFKKPKAKPVRKHKKRILSHDNDSDGEEEDNTSAISTPSGVRKSNRVRRGSNRSMSD
ncbi:condensin [Holotrichia oblita]|uniref:Condensin n=1 Tax=Holotrichia oblita TaxID=644536 RepID=A0ACB9TLQ6_HOLOL|nr:condensin [Holotrichia oblita]